MTRSTRAAEQEDGVYIHWITVKVEEQRRREMEEAAARHRLIAEARRANGDQTPLRHHLMNRVGGKLIDWGLRLQSHAALTWRSMDGAEFENEPLARY